MRSNTIIKIIGKDISILMAKNNKSCKRTSIGGQALMEGIMMRGPKVTAMAVRNTKGEIVIEKFPTVTKKRSKFFSLPLVRGIVGYIDSMTVGTKCLTRSAEIAGLEEAEEELRLEKEAKKAAKEAKKAEKAAKKAGVTTDPTAEERSEVAVEAVVEENTKASVISESTENESPEVAEASEAHDMPAAESTDAETSESTQSKTEEKAEVKGKGKKEKKKGSTLDGLMPIITVFAMILAIFLFIFVPSWLFNAAKGISIFGFLSNDDPLIQSLIKSAFESALRVIILVAYMSAMLLMKEIRRTFRFHGAEHKTIFCYEAGLELTVENVKKQKKQHPRCGTSFLIVMVLVSFFFSLLIDPLFYLIFQMETPIIVRTCIKILMLPLICGVGYELIKLAGKYDNWITKIISFPGILFQHITVLEPDDSMIECAIAAVKEVIPEDGSDNW